MAIDFATLRLTATLNELAEMLKHGALPYKAAKEQSGFKGVVFDESTKSRQEGPDSTIYEHYKVVSIIRDDQGDPRLLHYEPPYTPYTVTFCRRMPDGLQYLSVNFEDSIESLTIEPGSWYFD